jgi:hypothetical protein
LFPVAIGVTRHRVPAIHEASSYAAVGGLMSYGPNIPAACHQVGVYVGSRVPAASAHPFETHRTPDAAEG